MQVKLATVSGFCGDNGKFGVSGAIRLAQEAALSNPGKVYLIGELVHNEHVTNWLKKSYQIKVVSSLKKVPAKATLVIKAHGAPPALYQEAVKKNLNIIDATCPMVKAAQTILKQLIDHGKKVIYVASSKDHDEAVSVTSQVDHGVKIVTLAEIDDLDIKKPADTVVLTQTTLSMLETKEKFAQLQKKYPLLTIRPHLCQATTQRQQAVLALAQEVDLLIVVGAPHSSNSQRLLEVARSSQKPSYAVNEASEIDKSWFDPSILSVGVIAGASTPAWITQAVVKHLETL